MSKDKNKKRMICGGLAWTEDRDMKRLNELSKEGWMLSGFSYLSYELKKEEPKEYIYCMDSQKVENKEEYIQLFKDGGWEYILNYGDMYFYRALPGTKAIYSDKTSLAEKYSYIATQIRNIVIVLIAVVLALTPIAMIGETKIKIKLIKDIIEWAIIISAACAIPLSVCYLTLKRKYKMIAGNSHNIK